MAQTAHDLRTPLSSMRVALEVLSLAGADAEKRAKLIEMLNSQVDELAGILDKLPTDADPQPEEPP